MSVRVDRIKFVVESRLSDGGDTWKSRVLNGSKVSKNPTAI